MARLDDDHILQLPLGGMKNFVYLFACPETKAAAVVDPAWDADRILSEATERGWKISRILVTHTHHDHVNALEEVARRTGAPATVHSREADQLPPGSEAEPVEDGATLPLGRLRVEALHTPGHSPGALCFRVGSALFTGDTLFVGRTGRMVFDGGSQARMFESLQRLKELPDDLTVYPGHDYGPRPTSTLGREKRESPFFQPEDVEEFRRVADDWERENS